MFTQEEMYYRILTLVPNALFSLRGYSEEAVSLCLNPVQIEDWLIDWSSENIAPCPTLEQLSNIPDFNLQAIKDDQIQSSLVESLKENLGFVAAYGLAKNINPSLNFSNYVAQVQDLANNLN